MKTGYKKALYEHKGKKYYYIDLFKAMKDIGIKNGDAVFVHSDVSKFGKLADIKNRDEFLNLISNCLKEAVGPEGTIIMPTFSYSFTKDEIYDRRATSSTVGVLTEYFRKQKDAIRTNNPIFSCAVWGRAKRYFSSDLSKDCFGKKSIFSKMHNKNVKIIFLGAPFQSCTFVHYIEQLFNVPYRFHKSFAGKIKEKDAIYEDKYNYFVRPLDKNVELDLSRFQGYLLKNRSMRKVTLGHGEILEIDSSTLVKEGIKTLKKDNYFFLKEKPKGLR